MSAIETRAPVIRRRVDNADTASTIRSTVTPPASRTREPGTYRCRQPSTGVSREAGTYVLTPPPHTARSPRHSLNTVTAGPSSRTTIATPRARVMVFSASSRQRAIVTPGGALNTTTGRVRSGSCRCSTRMGTAEASMSMTSLRIALPPRCGVSAKARRSSTSRGRATTTRRVGSSDSIPTSTMMCTPSLAATTRVSTVHVAWSGSSEDGRSRTTARKPLLSSNFALVTAICLSDFLPAPRSRVASITPSGSAMTVGSFIAQ